MSIFTFGSSPNCPNCTSFSKLRAVLIMSLHFLGVSSTFPARKRQQAPVTWKKASTFTKWSACRYAIQCSITKALSVSINSTVEVSQERLNEHTNFYFNIVLNFYFFRGNTQNLEDCLFYTTSFQGQKPKAQFVPIQCCQAVLKLYYTSFFLSANTEVPALQLLLLKNNISKS